MEDTSYQGIYTRLFIAVTDAERQIYRIGEFLQEVRRECENAYLEEMRAELERKRSGAAAPGEAESPEAGD